MKEFKSFYKSVGGNEGGKCKYPTRLDTYGCGCQHDCSYCYAKSLLEFRGLWDAQEQSVASLEKLERKINRLEPGSIVRMGGMTDCFQPLEKRYRVTAGVLKMLNKRGIGYLIVTKSDLVCDYMLSANRCAFTTSHPSTRINDAACCFRCSATNFSVRSLLTSSICAMMRSLSLMLICISPLSTASFQAMRGNPSSASRRKPSAVPAPRTSSALSPPPFISCGFPRPLALRLRSIMSA